MERLSESRRAITAADLVEREVRAGNRNGVPTTVIVARRTYSTGQADLWNAVTTAERIGRWFSPISGNLELGGRFQLQDNAVGTIEACSEPESFSATWEFDGTLSWIDVCLTPAQSGTVLELRHEAPHDPDRWREYGPGAGGVGWDLGWLGLDQHLDQVHSVDEQWADEFLLTQSGVDFVRHSALAWAEAAVAYGDRKGEAHDAAERTIAFYTADSGASPPSS